MSLSKSSMNFTLNKKGIITPLTQSSINEVLFTPLTQPSYEDVMKATISTINIFQSSKRNKRMTLASSSSLYCRNSPRDETLRISNESLDESILTNSSFESERNLFHIEFQRSIENIETANRMYYNLKKVLNLKKKNDIEILLKNISVDMIEPSNLSNTVEKMKSALCHIQNIVAERSKLKEVLRSNVLNDVWHVNKDYHKSVVNFFTITSELVKNIHSLITSLENRKEFNQHEVKILKKREVEFQQLLYAYMDNLEELHCFVQQNSID